MNSVVEAKVNDLLTNELHYRPHDCGTVIEHIRDLARVAGHDLDERFAQAGLGAGPEARVASAIVEFALGGGGRETPEDAMRTEINRWIRINPRKGRR
jgi:hypothetical protein